MKNVNHMMEITGVKMRNQEIINYALGEYIIVVPNDLTKHRYDVLVSDKPEIINMTLVTARKVMRDLAIDQHLIIDGVGKYAEKEYRELPKQLQNKIIDISINEAFM